MTEAEELQPEVTGADNQIRLKLLKIEELKRNLEVKVGYISDLQKEYGAILELFKKTHPDINLEELKNPREITDSTLFITVDRIIKIRDFISDKDDVALSN